jgi:AraC-like DNA-binding protein
MLEHMEDLQIVSSFKSQTKPFGKKQGRPYHGFIFKIKGATEYYFEDRTVTLKEGEVIFLPRGAIYSYASVPSEKNLYMSINFQARIKDPMIRVYSLEYFHGATYLLENFSQLWKFGTSVDRYQCLSVFYDLLSYLARIEQEKDLNKEKHLIIEPALEYLKLHIYDSDFKLDKLHRLCGISGTYFRKLFEERFHVSPREYVISERLSHARSILESGDFDSIREVAEQVGYSDSLYFSKAFHRFYGCPPS